MDTPTTSKDLPEEKQKLPARNAMNASVGELVARPAVVSGTIVAFVCIVLFGAVWFQEQAERRQHDREINLSFKRQMEMRLSQLQVSYSKEKEEWLKMMQQRTANPVNPSKAIVVGNEVQKIDDSLRQGLDVPSFKSVSAPEKAAGSFLLMPTSPVDTVVPETRPTLHWSPLKGAVGYRIVTFDSQKRVVCQSPMLSKTEWKLDIPLRRGESYVWQASATYEGREASSPPTRFTVLDARSAEEMANEQSVHTLTSGIRYAQMGLLDEAQNAFASISVTDPSYAKAHKLLQDLHKKRQQAK